MRNLAAAAKETAVFRCGSNGGLVVTVDAADCRRRRGGGGEEKITGRRTSSDYILRTDGI